MVTRKPVIRPRVAVLAAVVGLGMLAAALPATANAQLWQITNSETRWCLDSNAQGQVYLNPCSASNNYQK